MRVLISGAFGYLGSRLIQLLEHDLVLGARTCPEWVQSSFGEFRPLDVLSADQVAEAVRGVDAIVHLASLDENEAARDPDLAVRVSAEGTRRMLAAARAEGVSRVIYMSTFHVYGPTGAAALDERTPARPVHPYGISRMAGEGYCYENNRLSTTTQAVVFRLSNGYGAPLHSSVDRWSLAHNDFCRQAQQTGKIVLKTSGLQHRDMIWVGDVAQAVDCVLRAEQLQHDVFHVGSGSSISMLELAETVRSCAEQRLRRPIAIERPAPLPGEASVPVRFSIERLRALGFTPRDALRDETERLLNLLQTEQQPS